MNEMTTYFDPNYSRLNHYAYFLKHPLRLMKAPIGWLLGQIIIPAQENNPTLNQLVSRNGYKASYYIEAKPSVFPIERESVHGEFEERVNNKKIIVFIGGNGFNVYPGEMRDYLGETTADVA